MATPNKDLQMTKAHHFVASIDYSFNKHLRLKIEPYYQKLFDVPVIADSSFSTINLDKAWQIRTNRFLSINGRLRLMGGNREIPVNYSLSEDMQDVVYDYSKRYESHQPAIIQVDLTLTYKINKPNHSSSWAL